MNQILVYSTEYHLQQADLIIDPLVAKFRVGFKRQWLVFRVLEFINCIIQLTIRFHKCGIYIPRSAAKDNWLVYVCFKKRCTLISDGLSDFLQILPVINRGFLKVGFELSVDPHFHISSRSLRKREIYYDSQGPVAVYNKRGRDPDYVLDYAVNLYNENIVLNPISGKFAKVYAAPSTVLFELPDEMKVHVKVVSHLNCRSIDTERQKILNSYENCLLKFGYKIIKSVNN